MIVSIPIVTPVTTPSFVTVALALFPDHIPPVIVSDKVIVESGHTSGAPVIVPAKGNGLTVTLAIAMHPAGKV